MLIRNVIGCIEDHSKSFTADSMVECMIRDHADLIRDLAVQKTTAPEVLSLCNTELKRYVVQIPPTAFACGNVPKLWHSAHGGEETAGHGRCPEGHDRH